MEPPKFLACERDIESFVHMFAKSFKGFDSWLKLLWVGLYSSALALLILKSSLDDVLFLHIFALVLNLFLIIGFFVFKLCWQLEVAFYNFCGLKLVFGSCFKVLCELFFNLVLVIFCFKPCYAVLRYIINQFKLVS